MDSVCLMTNHFSDATEWELFQETASKNFYQKTGLQLMTGAIYTVRVGVSNNAGILAIHETDGVKLDSTKPEVSSRYTFILEIIHAYFSKMSLFI